MEKSTSNKNTAFRKNILLTFVFAIILLVLYVSVPGYKWAISEMAFKNKELIEKIETRRLNNNLPELTDDMKRFFKIGNYWYLSYIRDQTPQSAVILLPPKSAVDTISEMNNINSSDWVEYFIYPRLCISEDEKERKPELYRKVTHVAIVNYWGYEKLNYIPSKMEKEAILPINNEPQK
jgi:hypothetical protein